jgi:predicted DNA-binding transcriptional regulator AlpA
MTALEELMQAAFTAPTQRQKDALLVLKGQALAVRPETRVPVIESCLTLRELAARLSVSRYTIWRWQLPAHSLGGVRRYRLTEVEAHMQSEEFRRRMASLRAGRREKTLARNPSTTGSPEPTPQNQ